MRLLDPPATPTPLLVPLAEIKFPGGVPGVAVNPPITLLCGGNVFCQGGLNAIWNITDKTLDTFDFDFNKKLNRALVFELATGRFIAQREDGLFLGPPGTGKSHLAQAIGHAVIQQGYRVRYTEAHGLLDELAEASVDGTRRDKMTELATVPLLIIDDLGMRRLPATAAEDLLELVMRRYERASTLLTSNRPVDDWGKLLGDTAAVTALLDRLLHHAHVLKCGPRSWRMRHHTLPAEGATQ